MVTMLHHWSVGRKDLPATQKGLIPHDHPRHYRASLAGRSFPGLRCPHKVGAQLRQPPHRRAAERDRHSALSQHSTRVAHDCPARRSVRISARCRGSRHVRAVVVLDASTEAIRPRLGTCPPTRRAIWQRYYKERRDALISQVEDLSEYEARMPRTPTGTNLIGIIKHVLNVEAVYLGATFGRQFPHAEELVAESAYELDPQADWYATADETTAGIIDLYCRVIAHCEQTVELLDLNTVGHVGALGWQGGHAALDPGAQLQRPRAAQRPGGHLARTGRRQRGVAAAGRQRAGTGTTGRRTSRN